MDLNPEVDLAINAADLTAEFKALSLKLFRYWLQKAEAERAHDMAKANLEETKAMVYKTIKADTSVKHTEKSLEAEIDTHPAVTAAKKMVVEAKHVANTWVGAVESMKAKKDMIIQLGSDRRKEV